MGLHDGEFLGRELSRLVEDLAGDGDLAHVVQRRGVHDKRQERRREVGLPRQLHVALQQLLRDHADVHDVQAAFAVAELHDVAEDVHHQVVGLLLLEDLVDDHALELLLLGVQRDGVLHAMPDDAAVERAADVLGGAQVVGVVHVGRRGFRRDDDDGQRVDEAALAQGGQHLEPVHHRHDDVQQHERDVVAFAVEDVERLDAVGCLDDVELAGQDVRKERPVDLGVVDDEDAFLLHRGRPMSAPLARAPGAASSALSR